MFKAETVESGATFDVRLFGDFDLSAYDEVDELLSDAQSNTEQEVVADMSGLTFIDSSGIRALLRAHLRAEEAGKHLRLKVGPPNVQRVFEVAGLDKRLDFIRTAEA
jgi:anti-anti-sigma factor